MSVFFIGAVDVHEAEKFIQYADGAVRTSLAAGAQILALDDSPKVHEGVAPGSRIILLMFPDQAAFDAWYNGPDYSSVRPLRWASATTHMGISVKGLN